jgi:hypothetical protein
MKKRLNLALAHSARSNSEQARMPQPPYVIEHGHDLANAAFVDRGDE